VESGADGLWLRAPDPSVTVAYHQVGSYPAAKIALPLDALTNFEGRDAALVTLESNAEGKVTTARWQDAGIPLVKEYEAPDLEKLPACPPLPEQWIANDPALLEALVEAARTAAREPPRFNTDQLQLRGKSGAIVATDGRQLLFQSGYRFPWQEDLLVPASAVFVSRELGQESFVEVGRTEEHVTVRVGPWAVHLRINKEGCFPQAERVIPQPKSGTTRWRLDPKDAVFLVKGLPRLPGNDAEYHPVTLDLNGEVVVRARSSEHANMTELVLTRSTCTGPAVRLYTDRQYLLRVAQLGLSEVCIEAADKPVLATGDGRKYVWVPLTKEGALASQPGATRITSADSAEKPEVPQPEWREEPVALPNPSGAGGNGAHDKSNTTQPANSSGINALIEEAEAIKTILRDAYDRTAHLLAGLKRQRKESQVVRNTLASLRQLQQLER
jgi:hypothetical protein